MYTTIVSPQKPQTKEPRKREGGREALEAAAVVPETETKEKKRFPQGRRERSCPSPQGRGAGRDQEFEFGGGRRRGKLEMRLVYYAGHTTFQREA